MRLLPFRALSIIDQSNLWILQRRCQIEMQSCFISVVKMTCTFSPTKCKQWHCIFENEYPINRIAMGLHPKFFFSLFKNCIFIFHFRHARFMSIYKNNWRSLQIYRNTHKLYKIICDRVNQSTSRRRAFLSKWREQLCAMQWGLPWWK